MSEDWGKKVKKLTLAYKTGWEYIPKSDEAGSVLMDVFLEMEGKNRDRCRKMWMKHELEFLQAVPAEDNKAKRLRTDLVVEASKKDSGKWLKEGTKAYTVLEREGLIRFRTCSDLTLTSATLRYGIRKKSLSAWLVYDSGAEVDTSVLGRTNRLFRASGSELAHPTFEWSFSGLCDGRESLSFAVELNEISENDETDGFDGNPEIGRNYETESSGSRTPLSGTWSVTDGQKVYPLSVKRIDNAFVLTGETPGFAERLGGERYTVRLEFPAGEEPTRKWLKALSEDITLREAAETVELKLCLTDEGAVDSGLVKPFGQALCEASCCYFVCDRAVAGREGELELKFTEIFETEERLPEQPREYEKLYRKYPWMKPESAVQEWQAGNTVWEYFDGNLWRVLPGSGEWKTGCRPEKTGEKAYRWTRPRDMQPCAVEGETHFYIRLRLISVSNAFAAYYHKYIPVMKDVRIEKGECALKPVERELPGWDEGQETKMYLGFDEEVTPKNSWYTGKENLFFHGEQIRGQGVMYGREAFWVEMDGGDAQEWQVLMSNYVEIRQEVSPDEERDTRMEIPAATDFSVEADDMDVLEAMSVSDTRYDKEGPPVEEHVRVKAAEHYFSHYGRLVTLYDMDLLVQERYPFLQVESCSLQEETGELQVALKCVSAFPGRTEKLLLEISEWLQKTISRTGALWLKGIDVKCTWSS